MRRFLTVLLVVISVHLLLYSQTDNVNGTLPRRSQMLFLTLSVGAVPQTQAVQCTAGPADIDLSDIFAENRYRVLKCARLPSSISP